MCRWMAWSGQPVLMEELLFKTQHGLIDQSLHSRMGAETTNGDGFGVGWYGAGEGPAMYHSVAPAWGDTNLRELAAHVETPLFLAHVRATSGTAVQQTNCHPFRHGRWLFVHNGVVAGFHVMRRELMLAVDPDLFADFHGSTDSEVIFRLALTFGLEEDPVGALEQAIGLVEETARKHGIEHAGPGQHGPQRRRPAVGVPLLHRRATRGRCSPPPTPTRCGSCTPRTRACSGCATRIGWSCPSRSPSCPGAWEEIPEASVLIVQPGRGRGAPVPAARGGGRQRVTQRKPMWLMPVSTICGRRAAGR